MVHLTSSESGIREAIEVVQAQYDNANYMIIGIMVLLYVAIVTILVIREWRVKRIYRDFGLVSMLSGFIMIPAMGVYALVFGITSVFFSPQEEQRDTLISDHIEANIDATVEYIETYDTSSDDPQWVRDAAYVVTVGIYSEDMLTPQDIVMAYHDERDAMLPMDATVLDTLPLTDGSVLAENQQESAGDSIGTHDE